MSKRNGDRARFQKQHKHKMLLRQRRRALLAPPRAKTPDEFVSDPTPKRPAAFRRVH